MPVATSRVRDLRPGTPAAPADGDHEPQRCPQRPCDGLQRASAVTGAPKLAAVTARPAASASRGPPALLRHSLYATAYERRR